MYGIDNSVMNVIEILVFLMRAEDVCAYIGTQE